MADLTDEEIAELRRLDAGASKGWSADTGTIHVGEPDPAKPQAPFGTTAIFATVNAGVEADILVAVAARNALPRLLDEVECLRKQLAAVSGPRWRDDMEALARASALLKRIEWSDKDLCPACGQFNPSASVQFVPAEFVGHKPGCELVALIGGK